MERKIYGVHERIIVEANIDVNGPYRVLLEIPSNATDGDINNVCHCLTLSDLARATKTGGAIDVMSREFEHGEETKADFRAVNLGGRMFLDRAPQTDPGYYYVGTTQVENITVGGRLSGSMGSVIELARLDEFPVFLNPDDPGAANRANVDAYLIEFCEHVYPVIKFFNGDPELAMKAIIKLRELRYDNDMMRSARDMVRVCKMHVEVQQAFAARGMQTELCMQDPRIGRIVPARPIMLSEGEDADPDASVSLLYGYLDEADDDEIEEDDAYLNDFWLGYELPDSTDENLLPIKVINQYPTDLAGTADVFAEALEKMMEGHYLLIVNGTEEWVSYVRLIGAAPYRLTF